MNIIKTIILALSIFTITSTSFAQSECNDRVFDLTGKVNTSSFQSELSALSSDGAETYIRVVTASKFNESGNLDKYAFNLMQKCSAWQSPGGKFKNNILVLAVAPELDSTQPWIGIYFSKFGSLAPLLQGQTSSVRNEMSNLGKDPNSAIKAGLVALHQKLSVKAAVNSVVGSGHVNGPVNVTINNKGPEKPTNFAPFYVLLALVIIGAGIWLFIKRQSIKENRRAEQQRAQTRRSECNNLIISCDEEIQQITSLLNTYKTTIHVDDFDLFKNNLVTFTQSLDAIKARFVNRQNSSNDPDSDNRSVSEYISMTHEFERSLEELNTFSRKLTPFKQTIRELQTIKPVSRNTIGDLIKLIDSANTEIAKAETSINVSKARNLVKSAIDMAESATKLWDEQRYFLVATKCTDGTKYVKEATAYVKSTLSQKKNIEIEIARLEPEATSARLDSIDTVIVSLDSYGQDAVTQAQTKKLYIESLLAELKTKVIAARQSLSLNALSNADSYIAEANAINKKINNSIKDIKDIGPAIDRKRKAASYSSSSSSYSRSKSSSRPSSHSTVIVNNGNNFGNDLYAISNMLERVELNAKREELNRLESSYRSSYDDDDSLRRNNNNSGWSSSSSSSYDSGFSGDSGSSSYDSGFGGDSGSSSSDSGFSSD